MISADVPDWSRESRRTFAWEPSRALLGSIRDYQRRQLQRGPIGLVLRKLAVARHRFWSVVTGADIPVTSNLGGGLVLPHPNGIVIHPGVLIGPNCLIFQQVTIGASGRGIPTIGGHVDIGAGAKIIGPVRIGNHARIGANALVVFDVPDHATVVGQPATILNGNTTRPDAQTVNPSWRTPCRQSFSRHRP